MKLLLKHELPRKLRSAQFYVEFLNASFYVSVDGSRASMMVRAFKLNLDML